MTSPEDLPSTEIVSERWSTAGGKQLWMERDGTGALYVRCHGCGLYERTPGMAPGFQRMVTHQPVCTS